MCGSSHALSRNLAPVLIRWKKSLHFIWAECDLMPTVLFCQTHFSLITMVVLVWPSPFALLLSYSRFRQICQSIIAHKLFDYVVLAFIFSNCITVALERPKILQGSLVNRKLCVLVCMLGATAPVCSFCVAAICILQGWILFYYLKSALSMVLVSLIAPTPLSKCEFVSLSLLWSRKESFLPSQTTFLLPSLWARWHSR